MAYELTKIKVRPGVVRDQTSTSQEGGWYDCDKVRFRAGYPEKIGGWTVSNFDAYIGKCRSLGVWVTTTNNNLMGVATNIKIYIDVGSTLYDITPIQDTFTTPNTDNAITTTAGSDLATITISGNTAQPGSYFTLAGVVGPVGGLSDTEYNREFTILSVSGDDIAVQLATPAVSSQVAGGGTAITAEFQLSVGRETLALGYGWGAGVYGRGTYGSASISPINLQPRLVFQDSFNDDFVFSIYDGAGAPLNDIYYWAFSGGFTARAVRLDSFITALAVPQKVGKILFAPSGHLLALSCTTYDALAAGPTYLGVYDPLLIRWANVDPDIGPEPENWKPELTNTAGFLRARSGSRIITGYRTRQEVLIWTDASLSSLQFLGTQEVFGLQELSNNVTIISPNAVAVTDSRVFWMGIDKFYVYTGRVDTLQCPLRQYVFKDIAMSAAPLVFAGTNNQYDEIIWFYASSESNEINRYVVYNYGENIWYYGRLTRTAWIDAGLRQKPQAAANGWLYNHEDGTDDGQPAGIPPLPISAYIETGDIDIGDGQQFLLTRRIIPDVNFSGSAFSNPVTAEPVTPKVTLTVSTRDFPGATLRPSDVAGVSNARHVETELVVDQYTNQVFVRARGRQMKFKISSDGLGTQWQAGDMRLDARPDGRRG